MNTETNPTQSNTRPRREARGVQTRHAMALVGVMMMLMFILAISLIGVATVSTQRTGDIGSRSNNLLQMNKKRLSSMNAETIADAGIRSAVQWISELASPPVNSSAFTPVEITPNEFYAGSGRTDSGKWTVVNFPVPTDSKQGQFKVRFYPHQDNAIAPQRAFLVESVATVDGVTRVVRADIKQRNFAQYAYFTDDVGSGTWLAGKTTFNGPVHINNSNNQDINIIWDSNSAANIARIFQWNGDNSFSMWRGNSDANVNKVKWQKNTSGNYVAPTTDADWKNVIVPKQTKDASGNIISEEKRTGPQLVSDKISMPTNSFEQRDAALGGFPVSSYDALGSGVYVPSTGGANGKTGTPTGGVYIKGQVDDMVMEAAGTGNRDQIIHVYQGAGATKYTLRMNANGTTTVDKYTKNSAGKYIAVNDTSYPKSFSGATTNGVVYSYDDIGNWSSGDGAGGLSGTVANSSTDASGNVSQLNKLTICTRIESTPSSGLQKTINIDGNILYANTSKTASQAQPDAGVLGLVAGYMKIVPNARVYEADVTGFEQKDASGNLMKDGSGNTLKIDGAYQNNAALSDLSVHATLMAYNTIGVDSYNSRPKGDFRLLGGYIAQIGSKFGQSKGGTGTDFADVIYGFQRILNYDKRVANQPPPYFPGTGQAYEIISYQRVLAPLQP